MIRIPEGVTIVGELRSNSDTRVDGRIHGKGNIDGTLLITETCIWTGNIIADDIIIEGIVEGDIIARKKLQICRNAKVRGSIKTPKLKLAEGAKLKCKIEMKEPSVAGLLEHRPLLDAPVTDELAEYRNKTRKTA